MGTNCPYCEKTFINGGGVAFNKHLKKHTDGLYNNFQCKECNKILSSNYSLRYHMKQHTEDAPRFPCSLCDSNFSDRHYRDIHEKRHGREKKKPYSPPQDFHTSLKPKYIIYVRKQKQIIRCLGLYSSLEDAVDHTGCGKDSLQNLYLDNGRKSRLSKVLIMQQLPKNKFYYKQKLDEDKTLNFN